jgi:hypothetical protein
MLVSLIVPTFNRARFLADLWNSVVAQAYRPVEFTVVDDGSTDDTVASFIDAANRMQTEGIRWQILLVPNRGAAVARNIGLRAAHGDAVMFVDSDDVLAPDGLANLARSLLRYPDVDYVYGKVVISDEAISPISAFPIGAPPVADGWCDEEIAGYDWHTMGALYRKRCLDAAGPWDEELTGSQDWEFQARVKLRGGRGRFCDTLVGYWRQHGSQRVGARAFRADYLSSAVMACEKIRASAVVADRCSAKLDNKLARRLILHALEWGAAGQRQAKVQVLGRIVARSQVDALKRSMARLLTMTPQVLDRKLLTLARSGFEKMSAAG